MPQYVDVAINHSQISGTYHYHLPPELTQVVMPGSLVIVPFGSQRVQGLVLGFVETPDVADTRPVEELVDDQPALTAAQIELAHWIADETLSPLGACVDLMLPPGLSQRTDSLIRLNPDHKIQIEELAPLEKRIISLLDKRGPLRGRQIDSAIRQVDWRGTLRKLVREGILLSRAILPEPTVGPKSVRKVRLAIPSDQITQHSESLSKVDSVQERRLRVLQYLAQQPSEVTPGEIYRHTGANHGDLIVLEKVSLIYIQEAQVWRDPLEDYSYVPSAPPELTQDQRHVWEQLSKGLRTAGGGKPQQPFLLHGVTGSGKTELYLRAVDQILAEGKQAMVLVPEISLTPQTVQRFLSRFPNQVGVIHSQLSAGERFDTWRRVRKGDISVVIGPRSALFMPLASLGLIIVDECHHESYDQQEGAPYYHGVHTAMAYARLSSAAIILGSATPNVTQYYQAVYGDWQYLSMPRRILAHRDAISQHAQRLGIALPVKPGEGQSADLGLPKVSIVDMRQELREGNRSIFSRELHNAIQHVLTTHQQAILFLNRRGSATYVFCRDCGYVVRCPRDDKPLTFHRSEDGLLCHTCGYQRQVPKTCPECGSKQIRQLGTGTEKVEEMVHQVFPGARTLRWDAETTRKKGAHEKILSQFTHQQADILIGTQMLAKGLDLPLVTLVGVILADVGLNLPDYRAAERTFQVLTQVAGRAGRSPLGGQVVMQTYEPDNYAINAAAQHDYEGFFAKEIDYRRELHYPPFSRLLRLEYRHHDPQKAQDTAENMFTQLQDWIADKSAKIEVIGPVPSFFSRLYGRYRWQIVLRGPDPVSLLRGCQIPDWIIEVDPSSLL